MKIWCICPFSRADFLSNTLENFDRQSYADKRLVLVANGTAANTRISHSKTTVLRSRTGLSEPMNIGLEYARKRCDADDWFCKFDDDDYYGPEYLNSIAQRANDSQAIARTKVWMRTPEGMLWTVDNGELSPHGPTLASRMDVADDFPEVHGWGEDGLWVQSMLAKGIVFSNGPLEGFCWIRYPKGHGHSYPLQSRHFRMLGVGIEEFGRYDVRVVDGQEIRQGKVLEPLPMDMADFAATLGASIGK